MYPASDQEPAAISRRPSPWRRIFLYVIITAAVLLIAAIAVVAYLVHNAEPLVRKRVVQTLSTRFNSPVELDHLHISLLKGVQVSGDGLRILYLAGPAHPDANPNAPPPMLSIRSFEFRTGIRQLFEPTSRVVTVNVQGMSIHIPPGVIHASSSPDNPKKRGQPILGIVVDEIVCTDTQLVLETSKPGKDPLVFNIASLTLKDVGAKSPLTYDAVLTNPKPVGDVTAHGHFGPWQNDNPRDTPIDGQYQFTHADLSTIHGIGGILSSTGSFTGTLGNITIDGTTDTPDFRIDVSAHPVALHTRFHAIVDGTSGDTTLSPVTAQFLHSTLIATGSVTRTKGVPGHTTDLHVISSGARIEDLLRLGVKASPSLMTGTLSLKTHLVIPPGPLSVSRKVHLEGNFDIQGAVFNNPNFQQTVDKLSKRAQGRPDQANAHDATLVASSMSGNFNTYDAVIHIDNLQYQLPGAGVHLDGQYSLDGTSLEFHGTVRTQATLSEMTTGWKSFLVSPLDRFFKKNGAGVELPIVISGTKSAPKFGLDLKKLDFGKPAPPTPPKPSQQ